jgi:hypothetical protein
MAPFARTTALAHVRQANREGRPSEYRPEYCQAIIDAMAEGISLTAFAGVIGVSKDTVYEWIKRHSDFSDAWSRAKPKRVLHLERKLLRARKGAETTAAIFALRNADPTEWRDVKSVQHDHRHSIDMLTDAELYAIASGNPQASGNTIDADYEDITTS